MAAKIAIIAMTTKSSIRVNALFADLFIEVPGYSASIHLCLPNGNTNLFVRQTGDDEIGPSILFRLAPGEEHPIHRFGLEALPSARLASV